jgi:hypothetical protein
MDTLWIAKSLVFTLNLSNSTISTLLSSICFLHDPFLSCEYCISSIVLRTTNLFHNTLICTLFIVFPHIGYSGWFTQCLFPHRCTHTCTTNFINVYFPLPLLVHENSLKIIWTNIPIKFLYFLSNNTPWPKCTPRQKDCGRNEWLVMA